MRNMSFMLTTEQVRNSTPENPLKDITRRLGWGFAKVGDLYMACVKCQGLGKGGKIETIRPVRVLSSAWEPLCGVSERPVRSDGDGRTEVQREGFPELTPADFMLMFCKHNRCDYLTPVNRIAFEYVEVE